MGSDETGILAYDLAGNWCEECGRAKSFRLWPGALTGCATCDEVITRHRCTGLPDISGMADGQSWECRDCGSVWTAGQETTPCPDCCADCDHRITARRWSVVKGDRMATAPRYQPQPYTPFRNALPRPLGPLRRTAPYDCYRMPNGSAVHVQPGCRCSR